MLLIVKITADLHFSTFENILIETELHYVSHFPFF